VLGESGSILGTAGRAAPTRRTSTWPFRASESVELDRTPRFQLRPQSNPPTAMAAAAPITTTRPARCTSRWIPRGGGAW